MESKIKADYLTAMKAKDAVGKSTLSLLISAMNNEKIALKRDLTDEDVLKLINKEIKKRNQSIEAYTLSKRVDLASKEEQEIRVLENYLPTAPTDSEIKAKFIALREEFPGIHEGKLFGMLNKFSQGLVKPEVIKQIMAEA